MNLQRIKLWIGFLAIIVANAAQASVEVVATTTSMAMLAKEVGGDQVEFTTLAPPDRDVHYLQAKPSMMLALRNADLVVAVGADLEIGWLPAAIRSSANPSIQEGNAGYFAAADQVALIDQAIADRSQGDVHPQGNPHFNLDPIRMATVGMALAERLSELDPDAAAHYKNNAQALSEKLKQLVPQLKTITAKAPGALFMHKSPDYLLHRLAVNAWGYMEPVPGIPPTADHIKELHDKLSGQQGVIIHAPYHQDQAAKKLAAQLNWPRFVLATEPAKGSGFDGYKALMLDWANALSGKPE